jgi:hypothetical protein
MFIDRVIIFGIPPLLPEVKAFGVSLPAFDGKPALLVDVQ